MNCPKCSGEMNPVNIGQTILECINCNYRQHIYLPELDINKIDADFSNEASSEVDLNIRQLLENETE